MKQQKHGYNSYGSNCFNPNRPYQLFHQKPLYVQRKTSQKHHFKAINGHSVFPVFSACLFWVPKKSEINVRYFLSASVWVGGA